MTDRVISNVATKWKRIAKAIGSIVAVSALAVLGYDFIQERQPNLVELKKTAVSVPYDDLTRKPEDHIGQIVRFRGKVIQVVPGEHNDKDVILIIWVGKGLTSLNDVVYVEYQPGVREPTILRNDVVEFWGKFKGIKTPEANHGNTDVPDVVAYEMQHIE
jgi:starvation-inducible outer membrane lipoprotein